MTMPTRRSITRRNRFPAVIAFARTSVLAIFLVFCGIAGPASADTSSAQTAWRLLDYLAVDYRVAVQNGQIVSDAEFAEMVEFSASAHERIVSLPASPAKGELVERAVALQGLINAKASNEVVSKAARSLAADLIKAYPVPLAPAAVPDFPRGRTLYDQNCASCHGANGDGSGEASAGLDPPPIAFADRERANERSVFALYQVIEQGIDGTSMASFAHLPAEDRWDLALYAGSLAYPDALVAEGKRVWDADASLRDRIDMEALVGLTRTSLSADIGADKADAVIAYLRRNPGAVTAETPRPLTLARERLQAAVAAYAAGDRAGAKDLALSAYLDGFEPVEPILSARDGALMIEIESAMGALRAGLARGAPVDEVRAQAVALDTLFVQAEAALAPEAGSALSSFLAAFMILLREGLEALLIVVAMLTFLRKAERSDAMPYVHGGWIAALVAGGATWAAATFVIDISGASRELMEGFGSAFAALVLLWVGVWMHGKSQADGWRRYISEKLSRALDARSLWLLFGLAFIIVYREVFETILFYAAIWSPQNAGSVFGGAAGAIAVLSVVAIAMTRYSRSLPIGKFFAYSSVLIAILAVVLIGKGVSALQEAGYLPINPLLGGPRIEILGLYPTAEGIGAQIVMVALLMLGFAYNWRSARRHRELSE